MPPRRPRLRSASAGRSASIATHHYRDIALRDLVAAKDGHVVSVCIPAHDEAVTVGWVVYRLRRVRELSGRDPQNPDDLLLLFLGLKLVELRAR